MIPQSTCWIARPHYQHKGPNWLLKTTNNILKENNVKWDIPMKQAFGQVNNILQAFAFEADNNSFPLLTQHNVHRDIFVITASEGAQFFTTIKELRLDTKSGEIVETDNDQIIPVDLVAGSSFAFDPTTIHYLVGTALFVIVDRIKELVTIEIQEVIDNEVSNELDESEYATFEEMDLKDTQDLNHEFGQDCE